jgi:exocyst complex component 3
LQVEQAHAGINALAVSQETINSLRENFIDIDKLCQECQTLIENHDRIKLLSNARNNLNTTLKDVQGMMSISVEAAAARDSLSDDKELIHTYEVVSCSLTCRLAQQFDNHNGYVLFI